MTVGQILLQSWKMLGEPSDLNPNDTTGTGRAYLLQGLNRAIRAVAFYKDWQSKEHFRYNQFRKEVFAKYTATTGTGAVGGSTSVLVLATLPTGEIDLTGAVATIGSETVVIASNSGVTCQLAEDLSATSVGAAYTIYPRWINIPSAQSYIEILKVEDMANDSELTRAPEEDTFLTNITNISPPSEYYRIGSRIYFNTVPSENGYFRLWLYRSPATVTSDLEVPELPESLHFGIILWLVYWGYQWMNEPTDAYAAQNRFTNYMRTTRNEMDVRNEMTDYYDLTIRVL